MSEFDQKQEELLLQLKNMPKPTISKELAKEMGFDQKKIWDNNWKFIKTNFRSKERKDERKL